MSKQSDYTYRACTEACSAAKCGRDSCTESHMSPVRPARLPLGLAHHMPDHALPARKAARAATSATSPDHASSVLTLTFLPAQMSPLPLGPVHRAPDDFSPARMVPRATTSVTSPVETLLGVSAMSQEPTRIAGTCSSHVSSNPAETGPLPVSLPLPRFAVTGTDMTPTPAQPHRTWWSRSSTRRPGRWPLSTIGRIRTL